MKKQKKISLGGASRAKLDSKLIVHYIHKRVEWQYHNFYFIYGLDISNLDVDSMFVPIILLVTLVWIFALSLLYSVTKLSGRK